MKLLWSSPLLTAQLHLPSLHLNHRNSPWTGWSKPSAPNSVFIGKKKKASKKEQKHAGWKCEKVKEDNTSMSEPTFLSAREDNLLNTSSHLNREREILSNELGKVVILVTTKLRQNPEKTLGQSVWSFLIACGRKWAWAVTTPTGKHTTSCLQETASAPKEIPAHTIENVS